MNEYTIAHCNYFKLTDVNLYNLKCKKSVSICRNEPR